MTTSNDEEALAELVLAIGGLISRGLPEHEGGKLLFKRLRLREDVMSAKAREWEAEIGSKYVGADTEDYVKAKVREWHGELVRAFLGALDESFDEAVTFLAEHFTLKRQVN
jgi:hypothetical protein